MLKRALIILLLSSLALADAKDEIIKLQDKQISDYASIVHTQEQYIQYLERNQSSPALLPWWAWTLIGASATTIIIGIRR